jgi:hypothetical protein
MPTPQPTPEPIEIVDGLLLPSYDTLRGRRVDVPLLLCEDGVKSLKFSMCTSEARCSGDTHLILEDDSGTVLALNDDSCGSCSEVVYEIPQNDSSSDDNLCTTYVLSQGCFGTTSCNGQVQIEVTPSITTAPTVSPTGPPTDITTACNAACDELQCLADCFACVTACQGSTSCQMACIPTENPTVAPSQESTPAPSNDVSDDQSTDPSLPSSITNEGDTEEDMSSNSGNNSNNNNAGRIAGATIGAIAGFALIALGVIAWTRRKAQSPTAGTLERGGEYSLNATPRLRSNEGSASVDHVV